MLETIQAMSLLTMMEVLGPILLGAGLFYGILMSRRHSRESKLRTETATRNLYREGASQEREEL